jgi:hypothetical protein
VLAVLTFSSYLLPLPLSNPAFSQLTQINHNPTINMAVHQLFKMLTLFLIGLVAMTTASPVGVPTTSGVSVSIAVPGDVSIAIPADISGDIPNDVLTEVNCYRRVYINLFCKRVGLSENQCFELQCKDPDVS